MRKLKPTIDSLLRDAHELGERRKRLNEELEEKEKRLYKDEFRVYDSFMKIVGEDQAGKVFKITLVDGRTRRACKISPVLVDEKRKLDCVDTNTEHKNFLLTLAEIKTLQIL